MVQRVDLIGSLCGFASACASSLSVLITVHGGQMFRMFSESSQSYSQQLFSLSLTKSTANSPPRSVKRCTNCLGFSHAIYCRYCFTLYMFISAPRSFLSLRRHPHCTRQLTFPPILPNILPPSTRKVKLCPS